MHIEDGKKDKVTLIAVVACVLLTLSTLAGAQTESLTTGQVQPLATTTCSFPFSAGSGNAHIDFCVSANGNIVNIATPSGHEHIAVSGATIGEGYGICNETPATEYHDWAGWGDSGNWNATTLVSLTATSVKLARTTSDGVWTLTQTISIVASNSAAKIVMTLKNNTAAPRVGYLVRYADISADGRFLNNLDSTHNSSAAWNTTGSTNPYGLALQNIGNPGFSFSNGYTQPMPNPPNACAFAFNYTGAALIGVNGSVVMAYVTNVPANSSRTATMMYRGF
jgi:hypothetical protein